MELKPAPDPLPRFHVMSYLLGLLTALCLTGGSVLLLRRADPAPIVLQPPPSPAPTATLEPTGTPAPLIIYVSGAVGKPGLYTLAAGPRVGDALLAAGGLLPAVDPALINQAEKLYDGAQLYVPPNSATTALTPIAMVPAPTIGQPAAPIGVGLELPPLAGVSGQLPTPTAAAANRESLTTGAALIDVNTASAEELDQLPGIGPSKARDIIAGRPFQTIDDLDRVPGIGAATLERLRPLVTVGP